MLIEISEGEMLPKGYGISYRHYSRRVWVCYPFPFNHFVRLFRDIWFRVRNTKPDSFTRELSRLEEEVWDLRTRLTNCEEERAKAQATIDRAMNIYTDATEEAKKRLNTR